MIENRATSHLCYRWATTPAEEMEMLPVDEREQIRRAYYVEHKPKRQIARELGHARTTVEKALEDAATAGYHLSQPRSAPVLGPVKAQIDAWVLENTTLPRKQRYTSHTIFKKLQTECGFTGGESTVRGYISRERQRRQRPEVFLPLEFDPGQDAQVDWGEAEVELAGERLTVQLFVIRLCYSRRLFVMAFPTQKQESFFEGHVQAFHVFGGVPHTLSYDNLGSAVTRASSPFAATTCLPAASARRAKAMKRAAWSTAWAMPGATSWRVAQPSRRLKRSTRTCAPRVRPMSNVNPMAGLVRSGRRSRKNNRSCAPCPRMSLPVVSACP
jgi:transposase